jgi:zinc/manganese transport system ATP-binding protein
VIQIQDLTLAVPDKILLQNFSAMIQGGERIGIFGPNGAGKSTFLKGLINIFPRSTGNIVLGSQKIAFLPQEMDNLPMNYSVEGFLQLLIRGNKLGVPFYTKSDRQRCKEMLAQVGALPLQKKRMKDLSGGERKRVMLATLLIEEPDIVLLDEPLANLDPRYQYELLQLIEQLQKKYHFTLLITAHDFNPLLHLLDRVMFIGQGQAILDTPEKVIQSEVLSSLYQTSLQVIELNGRTWVLSNEQRAFLNPDEHCHGKNCHVSI